MIQILPTPTSPSVTDSLGLFILNTVVYNIKMKLCARRTFMKKTALIMAGGRGERFWPSSRKNLPKQFLSLTGDGKTMIQLTVERILPLVDMEDIYIATNKDYKVTDYSSSGLFLSYVNIDLHRPMPYIHFDSY